MDRSRCVEPPAECASVRAHLIGVATRGLCGVAQVLARSGISVTGSQADLTPTVRRLREMGIRVHTGAIPSPYSRRARFVIYRPGTDRVHPERLRAARRGIEQWSPIDWLRRSLLRQTGVAVVGQREASVASAMIAWTLARAGLDPTVVLTNAAPQLGGWARHGEGPHFVVEVLDTPDGLGSVGPQIAVLLDLGAGEAWPGRRERAEALGAFIASVPRGGLVLSLDRHERALEARHALNPGTDWVSLDRPEGWWPADLREERGHCRFRVFHRDQFAVELRLQAPGRRHIMSALAAIAVCDHLSVPLREIGEALEEFTGLSRDFESRGSYRGVTLVDDESWEASSVGETLMVARQVFGRRRIWAVHGTDEGSVGSCDAERYVPAFVSADQVLIADGRGESSPLLRALLTGGVRARGVAGLDDAILELDRCLEPGDVLVTLGNGDVGTIADAFIRRLPRNRPGQ